MKAACHTYAKYKIWKRTCAWVGDSLPSRPVTYLVGKDSYVRGGYMIGLAEFGTRLLLAHVLIVEECELIIVEKAIT